jgi:hypothetical protein
MLARHTSIAFTVIPNAFRNHPRYCSGTIYTLARHRGRIYHALGSVPARSYSKSL